MNTPTPRPQLLVSAHLLAVLFAILALAIVPTPAHAASIARATPPAASAATLTVTRTDDPAPNGCMPADCSLREAILAAAPAEVPTVTLPAGIYTLSRGALTISHDLTLTGTLSTTTVIDGGGLDRVLTITSVQVAISDVTIRNGNVGLAGGGIHNQGDLTLTRAIISDNTAHNVEEHGPNGGGIVNTGAMTIEDSLIRDNQADGSDSGAGAIMNTGTLTVRRSRIQHNSAYWGGGILNMGTLDIVSSDVLSNTANEEGGGILNNANSVVSLKNVTLANNFAGHGGGAVENSGTMTLIDSTISGNEGLGSGGGLTNSGTLRLVNVTVSGNRTKLDGGGIQNHGTLSLLNATIANNVADDDGNGMGEGGGVANIAGTVGVTNTVLADNRQALAQASDCTGMLVSYGHNAIDNASGCTVTGISAGNRIGADPALDQLAQNGGPTLTHALLPGSILIDAGDPAACPTSDQRGFARPIDGDRNGVAVCDIGAFELHVTYRMYLPAMIR